MSDHSKNELQDAVADVATQRVARVYAEALLNAADKRGEGDAVLEELEAMIGQVFKADPLCESFFSSSAIGREKKERAIQSAVAGRVSEVFANFLGVLNKHDRLDLLRPILAAARQLRDERARRIRVQVRTAVPLPDDQADKLRREIRDFFQREPILETQVEPELLGGVVVRVADWLYDASVRTEIDKIRTELLARGSHEIQSGRDRFSTAV